MSETQPQASGRAHLNCERKSGNAPGTIIFHFTGPFTARTIFASQSPDAVSAIFDLHSMLPTGELPSRNIFDLTDVPYMDSWGLGMVVRHYARCKDKGVQFTAAGVSPRVLELFQLTKVDSIIPMTATLAEADAR